MIVIFFKLFLVFLYVRWINFGGLFEVLEMFKKDFMFSFL